MYKKVGHTPQVVANEWRQLGGIYRVDTGTFTRVPTYMAY